MLLRKRKQLFNNQFILLTISKFTLMKKLFVCALALAAFVACDNGPEGGVEVNENGKVFLKFSISAVTRSATDNAGESNSDANPDIEVGFPEENKVSTVDIVMSANGANLVVAENVAPEGADDTYVATFKSNSLQPDTQYQVFVYVNGKGQQTLDAVYNVTEDNLRETIAKDEYFLMTNADNDNKVSFTESELAQCTSPDKALALGTIMVERAVARFDFMPRFNNEYTIGENEGTATVQVKLTDLALINMSKAFYYMRRVSPTGTAEGATVGGDELMNNYVVDTDAAEKVNASKMAGEALATLSEKNFFYPMTTIPTNWTKISDLNKVDNWDGTYGSEKDDNYNHTGEALNDYLVWRYAIENTIPAGADNQVHAISTGVVFKGYLMATENASDEVKAALAGSETVYVFKNVLYGTWAQIAAAVDADTAPASLIAAYNQVEGVDGEPTADDYAAAGFTGYTPNADGKFEVLYYYWNRHNDNNNDNLMGIMEFDVVRNNVYKLCVDKISKFGHPANDTDPDPDPVDPEDPDESQDYYFKVTVKVLPWVVRVNHIEF